MRCADPNGTRQKQGVPEGAPCVPDDVFVASSSDQGNAFRSAFVGTEKL